ncbi:MAG: MBL fold metallo-hydrolase [Treponema sp.]|nr:MBL fold metallo-hydrolase [Treponema sp.]MEE3435842.1 MBL fold metallo-hydrolase [Treponema sp.]
MKRTFFGVGQGAFYCETFCETYVQKDFKTVQKPKLQAIYDCGSFEKRKTSLIIEKELNHDCDTILFISHFHYDHISGIPELLKKLKIKCIIFPYIMPEDREFLITYNKCLIRYVAYYESEIDIAKEEDFITRFIENPWSVINDNRYIKYNDDEKNNVKLYCIAPFDETNSNNSKLDLGSWNNCSIINSGEKLKQLIFNNLDIDWQFIAYNLYDKCIKETLILELEREFKENFSLHEFYDKYLRQKEYSQKKENFNKLKNVFKRTRDSNTNSMILFSFNSSIVLSRKIEGFDKNGCKIEREEIKAFNNVDMKVGFLFMGDYDALNNFGIVERIGENKKIWNLIDGIQIPHHGSINSFNIDITKRCKYCIISANPNFHFEHPDEEVISFLRDIPYVIINDFSTCVGLAWTPSSPKSKPQN